MKICWDNLERVSLSNYGNLVVGGDIYIEMAACVVCGKPYLAARYSNRPLSKHCSKSCGKMGHKVSSVTRNKIKDTRIERGCGIGNKYALGMKHTEENKKFFAVQLREAMLKRIENGTAPNVKNSDNPNWKGGVRKKNLPLYNTYAHQIDYAHEVKLIIKEGIELLGVRCKNCNEWFIPKTSNVQSRIGSLVGRNSGEGNFYCSEECKENCSVFHQQTWPKNHKPRKVNKSIWYTDAELKIWRDEVLKRENYICEYCGGKATIAHHNKPKKLEPFFALDLDYGTACCEKCHYKYGHQGECNTANLARVECK